MSIVLAHQPHFTQPADAGVLGLRPVADRSATVPKPMEQCNGARSPGTLRPPAFDLSTVETGNCIPCRMPYITSMFMPRMPGDRRPVPAGSQNLAFVSQFVELADDVVFTVEYRWAAQTAVYELLHIDRKIPPVTRHDRSIKAEFEALVKAFE